MPEKHEIENCPQEKRLERIEMIMDGLVKQLATSNESLVAIRILLEGKIEKYDNHVDSGERWRSEITKMLITACLAGVCSTVGFGIWVGRISQQVETNTTRWERFLAVEAKMSSAHLQEMK
jgi:hypothetical protein